MVRVPRDVGPRTRSDPEGSSLKRSPAGAAGKPGQEPPAARAPGEPASTEGARSTPFLQPAHGDRPRDPPASGPGDELDPVRAAAQPARREPQRVGAPRRAAARLLPVHGAL